MNEFNLTSVSNSKGFTLLEILIAIVLLAFVVLGVVNITENAFQTKDRTTEINKNNLQIETAMSRFEWDVSQIYSPLYFSPVMNFNQNTNFGDNSGSQSGDQSGLQSGDQSGMQAGSQAGLQGGMSPYAQQYMETLVTRFQRDEHFQNVSQTGIPVPRFLSPEKNIFEFFTSSNRRKLQNTKQSYFAWVRYSLADQEPMPAGTGEEENEKIPKGLKSFVRYFTADDPYSNKKINIDDEQRIKGAVLLRNVESLEFQFWDLNRRKWETSLKNIQQGESIIRGVKIIIAWYDSFGNKRTSTRIFRPHWPLVVPQDQSTNVAAGAVAGATAGNTSGSTSGSTAGNNAGVNSGLNGGSVGN